MTGAHADVLVVGAGASGGVLARRLVEAGLDVVCLERGGWPDPADYPGAGDEWELHAEGRWAPSPNLRRRRQDTPYDLAASDQAVLDWSGVGGGTVLFAGQWPRMLPDDFRVRSVDGVADDWPLSYEELLPFSERVDRQFGVSGLGGNPAYPPGADPPLPPLPIGELAGRVAREHARRGWHWWPQPNAILSAPYDGRRPCVQRGTCQTGCNEGAKASTDVTHWNRVVAGGGRVVTGAVVLRVTVDARGRADGVEWQDPTGFLHRQTADVVVLAANGVGTARLLLDSDVPGRPEGLANSSGLVGRRLMLHPIIRARGLFDGATKGWRAHSGGLIQSLEFAGSDPARGFLRGATWELGTAGGPLGLSFVPDGRGFWGPGHHRHVRDRLEASAYWDVLCEDLPEEANHVGRSERLGADGRPLTRIAYQQSANTTAMLAWHAERARESLEGAGAHHVELTEHHANGHLMGTARMGDDPATSVVDRWGVAHDVANLVVVDGSVFVTAGSANPTSTIAALALRAAEHLLDTRDDVPRPVRATTIALPTRPGPRALDVAGQPMGPDRRGELPELDDALRDALARWADGQLPAEDGMPAPSEVGVHRALLDRVLAARPELAVPFAAALRSHLDDPDRPLDARAERRLRFVVAGAYYLSPVVRAAMGYRTEPPTPVRPDEYPSYVADGSLDHLVEPRP